MCNAYCFSMATVVARTHLNDTFVRTLPVLLHALFNDAVNCFDYIVSVILNGCGALAELF